MGDEKDSDPGPVSYTHLSAIVCGITTIVWEIAGKPWGVATIFATLVTTIVSLVVVTLVTPPPEAKYLERFQFEKKAKKA